MAETLFKSGNHPVAIGSTTVIRAQNFRVGTRKTLEEVYQLGNEGAIGLDDGVSTHDGSLTWFPINTLVENAIVGVSSTTDQVSLADIIAADAVDISGPANTRGLTSAKTTSLEYSVQQQGRFQAVANFRGTAYDNDGAVVTPDTPSGLAAYKAQHAMVRFAGYAYSLLRIRSLRLRINLATDEAYELFNADPFDTDILNPQLSLELEFYSNYEPAGDQAHSLRPQPTISSPLDVTIQFGSTKTWDAAGNLQFILKNMVLEQQDHSVQVRQRAFQRMSYRSAQDNTLNGFAVKVISGP